MHRCFWKQQRIRSMRLLRLSGIRIRCISAGFFISRKDVRHRNVGRGIVKKGLTSCQALFNSISSYLTFYINDNTVVTHRVIDKDNDTESFHTKGDANETEDGGSVAYDKVVGKVVLNVPYLGYILR